MKQMKMLVPFLLYFSLQTKAQADTLWMRQKLHSCADSFTEAFMKKDWDQFIRYSNPAMIASMGGNEPYKIVVAGNFAKIPEGAWKKYQADSILQIVKTANEWQAVLSLNSVLEMNGLLIYTTSSLIGQSWDGGSFWTFFGNEGNKSIAQMIKPDLSDAIRIPPKKEYSKPLKQ
ncbi:MAG TPA: hypothetical protein PK275_05335 [Chitinophagaceae bacterium]|jgi:hypothetical protein|nr:hypothetical protein [Chitinophagaceae bacterium]